MPDKPLIRTLIATALLVCGSAAPAQKKPAQAVQPTGPEPILRANFLAQMDAQFGKVDSDRNGQLSQTEIEQFEKQKAVADAQARNDALFDQLDANKNGQISAKEFAKLVAEPPAVSAQPLLSRQDSNRDGQISLIEHRSATLANFDRIDTDRDGVVSPAEMKAGGIAPR